MKIQDLDRADLEADVVEALLRGDRVVVVGTTAEAATAIFRTIADAFADDVIPGTTIRRKKGMERIDLPNAGRLHILNVRTADLTIRGLAMDRIYTPAGTGDADKLLRVFEAATIQSARPTVLRYAERIQA